ncbi:MAG: CsbD family protein [Rhodanobacteraceae bacterium]
MTTLPPLTRVDTSSAIFGQDRIRDEWSDIAGRIRRRWRKLTSDDVAFPGGSAEYLARVLQDRYGVDRREALLQVYEFESEL